MVLADASAIFLSLIPRLKIIAGARRRRATLKP
jgi:hypothetical protein